MPPGALAVVAVALFRQPGAGWSGRTIAHGAASLLPPPLAGEGWGGGSLVRSAPWNCPLPAPSSASGGGNPAWRSRDGFVPPTARFFSLPPIEIGCCRFRSLKRVAETRVYAVSAGGGSGWGVVPLGTAVPPHPTPTPDPSPAEPGCSRGSATQKSDPNRQQPTWVGGGEKRRRRRRGKLDQYRHALCSARRIERAHGGLAARQGAPLVALEPRELCGKIGDDQREFQRAPRPPECGLAHVVRHRDAA